jgi:hypothetical protein
MSKKPSSRNTRTFYIEDIVNDIITDVAERNHGGNRSEYVKSLVIGDLHQRLSGKQDEEMVSK